MTEYETIVLGIEDDIAVVRLNRPERLNALNVRMRAEICHAVKLASDEARVVVLTGEGQAFCSGQDLGDGGSAANLNLEQTLRDEYFPMLQAIYDCPVPTIAAVNGAAAGAGANLALTADVVVASDKAYFLQAFTRIGLIPDAGGTYFMPRMIGSAKAMGAALFAEKITAKQADDWGLIWEAVDSEIFEETWRARAAHLASGPTKAYASAKEAIRGTWDSTFAAQLRHEAKLQGSCGRSRDFKEGVLAFTEKRSPSFEGR
ncbi:MAG: enoyl-CoA hydratase-related protein [Aestuariivita sp.]|nr:enoyl-CoA hydratase-related protein [Aestuariivita sp.]MCY4202269.1 enoyl-CoA hydratase-related protein [Aestuariivita sp.]MCY4289879.1 enoyl-CoA hydratase-related protein [Aestuariivita sp.]MCY4346715.1 enoyl-CoA hydratase-related protein [Aestuariivita sp.]